METIKRLFDVLKSLSTPWRIVVLLALSAIAFALSSCARSSIAFKGQGEVEFVYKGTNGPNFKSDAQ